jgi:hypothetical protein
MASALPAPRAIAGAQRHHHAALGCSFRGLRPCSPAAGTEILSRRRGIAQGHGRFWSPTLHRRSVVPCVSGSEHRSGGNPGLLRGFVREVFGTPQARGCRSSPGWVGDERASGLYPDCRRSHDDPLSLTPTTLECLAAIPDTSISGRRVARELTVLIETRGKPGMIVSDNGTEFTSNAILG